MRLLRANDRISTPWKNGGGVTTEIAVFPPGADLGAFGWRVSLATVDADGPFSCFDGVDRVLTVLSGEGIVLEIDGATPKRLTPATLPTAFPGDVPADARLMAGTVTDLNVMTRRGAWSGSVTRIRAADHIGLADTTMLFMLEPCAILTPPGSLEPGDALILGCDEHLTGPQAFEVLRIVLTPEGGVTQVERSART